MKKIAYCLLSFVAGFSLMTLELVSSRITAPLIGASVYTWTAVIGVTLFGLALGSYIGGVVADRFPLGKTLPLSFAISALLSVCVPFLSRHTEWIISSSSSIMILSILLSVYLFLLPALAIGLIQPLIVKKYVDDFSELGKKYGLLSTLWSLGSILGVFLTGFYFISFLGSKETIFLVALLLAISGIVSAFLAEEKKMMAVLAMITALVGISWASSQGNASTSSVVFEDETAYYTARVVDFNEPPYGASRALLLDFDTHSITSRGDSVHMDYTQIHPLFKHLKGSLENILVIGAGAYTLPNNLKNFYKDSNVSVLEIDPQVEEISKKYFGLDTEKITTKIGDARSIVAQEKGSYDLIFGDAYNSFISVPGHLLTREFNASITKILSPGGIYAINFISALEGQKGEMFKSVYATFRTTFPHHYIVRWGANPASPHNVTLIGVNDTRIADPVGLKAALLRAGSRALSEKIVLDPSLYDSPSGLVLTDNFFPTERMMDPIIKDYYPEFRKFMKKLY